MRRCIPLLIAADYRGNYDSSGNREEIKEDDVQVADYTVDAFNRVTCDGTYHYDYDPEGNRVAKFVDGTPANGTLDSGDTDWTEYTWDNRNRLIQVESGATYGTTDVTVAFGYDWLNRWISTDVDYASADDTAEYFVYGVATLPDEVAPWDRAATDLRDVGQITLRLDDTEKITNRYLWGPAVDQILADEQVEWNAVAEDYDIDQILWPLTDHQGTTRDLAKVNATSGDTEIVNTRSYDAYGILLAETAPAVDHLFGFTARITQTDAGLVNCLNRWYDPEVGTWLNEDLIGFEGGDANLYRYCGNDPVNSVDPSGLIIETIWDVGMLAWDIGCAVKNTVETTYHGAATGVHWARGDAEAQAESWKKTKENARELAWNAVDLGVDAASTALPGVPAGGSKAARAVAKGGKEVLEEAPGALNKANKAADAVDAARKADGIPDAWKRGSDIVDETGKKVCGKWLSTKEWVAEKANEILKKWKKAGAGTGARSGQHGDPYNRAAQELREMAKNKGLLDDVREELLRKARQFEQRAREINHPMQ